MALSGVGGVEMRLTANGEALDITPSVRRFVWTESMIEGGFTWSMEMSTNDWSMWDDVIVGSVDPQVRLTYQGVDGDLSTEWRTAVVDRSSLTYSNTALTFSVSGADRRLHMLQKDRTRAWLESTVSDVVRAIAAEYGLDALTERTGYRTDRWQVRENDWAFLVRLTAAAASAAGRGDMYLWLDESKLYHQSPNVQRASDRRHAMHEVEDRVDRVVVGYNGREVDRGGGATLRVVSFDVDTKEERVFTVDAADAQSVPALARRVPRAQEDGLRVYPSTSNEVAHLEEIARAHWGALAPRYFSLLVDTRPDLALKPNMVMEVQGTLDEVHDSAFLGRYVVLEVKHELTPIDPQDVRTGGLSTTAICYRRESYVGAAEPTGASAVGVGTRDRYHRGGEQVPTTTLIAEVPQ